MLTIEAPALDTFSSTPALASVAADLVAGDDDYTYTLDRTLSDDEKAALDAAQCTVYQGTVVTQAYINTGVDPDMIEAFQAAVDEMEGSVSWVSDDGNTVRPSVVCRPPRHGEAAGVYLERSNGDLQILGYTVPTPDALRDLLNRAWNRACNA